FIVKGKRAVKKMIPLDLILFVGISFDSGGLTIDAVKRRRLFQQNFIKIKISINENKEYFFYCTN
ncbi:MAG: hypothetical protein ACTHK0_17090, partial [Ginsengibacter sp.]